ncbi:MAG: hypothetical protein RQ982_04695, partial [Gammaproteobacteria bacterium]|nr:hypothetical protein [Gammaproteobacteria bacterium]
STAASTGTTEPFLPTRPNLPLDKLMSKSATEDALSTSLKDVQQRDLLDKQSQLKQQRLRVNDLRSRGNE